MLLLPNQFSHKQEFPICDQEVNHCGGFPKFLEEKNKWTKLFAGVLGHELMECLRVWYGKITKLIKEKAKEKYVPHSKYQSATRLVPRIW